MTNLEVAKLLRAVAAAYEVKDKKPNTRFKIIAYQRAADAIEHSTSEVKDLWEEGKLNEIAGVGSAIAAYLDELFKTGKVKHLESVMATLPPAMFELLDIPGIGAKTAYKLTKELGITKAHGALEKLEKSAEKGHIQKIEGFAQQSEKEILESIKQVRSRTKRYLLPYAAGIADHVLEYLCKSPYIKRADSLGSLRRRVSTVGDVDIAVASDAPKKAIEHFTKYPKKVKVIEAGEHTSSILLPGGVQVDLMVQPAKGYGALIAHFTGSKHHNVALRTYAIKKGLSLSEYGIKKGKKLILVSNEEEFYKMLDMEWIPPELREDQGEIEAAIEHMLPHLIEHKDIKGDCHLHSNYPQQTAHDTGANSMSDMANEAERLGYEYIAFTEHNLKFDESEKKILDVLKRKKEMVEQLNDSRGMSREKRLKRVFNSLEIDIKPDGRLALPEKAFDLLDFAVVAIHSSFKGSKEKQTKRVLAALAYPKVKIFAHPTARKLQEREEVDLDWEKVFESCKKHNIFLEINAFPDRLDLPDVLVHEAVKQGIKLIINTDSHAVDHMHLMRYGVSVARRGWAQRGDIMNTLPLARFEREVI